MPVTISNADIDVAPTVFISPFSKEAWQAAQRAGNGSPPLSSAIYIAAQRALYFPISIRRQIVVKRFFWVNGTTASTDNVQVGVYSDAGAAIVRGTSTTASGTSAAQFDNVTDFVLPAGLYYIAIWCSGTTTHLVRGNAAARYLLGTYQQSSLAGGLPTTASFTRAGSSYQPLFGLALRSSP